MQIARNAQPESAQFFTPVRSPLLQRKCACGNLAGSTGECSECQSKLFTRQGGGGERDESTPLLHDLIQPKLRVGAPDDKYEQEADQVAEEVMRMPDPTVWVQQQSQDPELEELEEESALRLKPLAETMALLNEGMNLSDYKRGSGRHSHRFIPVISNAETITPLVQRSPAGVTQVQPNLENRLNASQSGGAPLSEDLRTFMEPRFGTDFSQVRMHTDSVSALSARNINALAYTFDDHIVFGPGAYQPQTSAGRQLIAHELAHVVQQEMRPLSPRVVQRQLRQSGRRSTSTGSLSEARRRELHQLARRPAQLANLWSRLSEDEKSEIILAMDSAYGSVFTDRFYWYASHGQLSGGGAHVLPQQAEETSYPDTRGFAVGHPRDRGYIHVETFSNGTQVWLHPSGREIWLTSPPTPESASPGLRRVRDLLLQARQLLALDMELEPGEEMEVHPGELLDEARAVVPTLNESEQKIAEEEIQAFAMLLDPLGLELWR